MRERRVGYIFAAVAITFARLGYEWLCAVDGQWNLGPRGPDGLRIVSWKVGGSGDGGRALSDKDLPHMAKVIQTLDADMVLFQEFKHSNQAHMLKALLAGDWQVIVAPGQGHRVAFAWQRGKVHPWYSLDSDRHAALCPVYRPRQKMPVAVVNIDAGASSARRRNDTIGRSFDLLMRFNQVRGKVLAGDLNLDVETYNYVARYMQDAAAHAGSTAELDRRLDYIFVKADTLRVDQAGPWKGKRIADMDHDPVVGDLQFR